MRHLGRQHSNAILFVLMLVISATAFVCTDAAAVDPPGAKVSPLSPSRMFLFRDDEIFLSEIYYQDSKSLYATISPNSSTMTSDTWPVVTGNSSIHNLIPLNKPLHRLAAASAGRFLDPASEAGPYRQSAVYAYEPLAKPSF